MQVRMQALVAITEVRILCAENPRFLRLCSSDGGKAVPKVRPEGVADGHPVDNLDPDRGHWEDAS